MPVGTVKWFNPTKGFGFIAPDTAGDDIFLHISAVERAGISSPNEGDRLSYQIAEGRDGRSCAEDISRAEPDAD
jgi:CspA family cold shock protein